MPSILLNQGLVFALLLLLFSLVHAQTNNGTVRVGDSLIAGNDKATWLSPSEDFAFGFHQLEDGNFIPAIWFNKIQQDNVVWYASEDKPAPRNSKLELTADSGLVLTSPRGDTLWSSQSSGAAFGAMNDTGNFELVGADSRTVWESFKNPRDTLLPSQVMEVEPDGLFSRRRPNDFSTGRYQFRLLSDGNAVLNTVDITTKLAYDSYYESNTFDNGNVSNSGKQVIFDGLGYLYIRRSNGVWFNITSPGDVLAFPASRYYHKMTIRFDGVFVLSAYSKSSQPANASWEKVKVIPDNICRAVIYTGTGPCWYNSICALGSDRTPICKCPVGYSLIDSTDVYSGCKPDSLPSCDSDGHDELVAMQSVDWPLTDFESSKPTNNEDCKESCLRDCLCVVVVYNSDQGGCWKKKLPLSNGLEEWGRPTTANIKLGNSSNLPVLRTFNEATQSKNTLVIVMSALLASSAFVNFVLITAMCLAFCLYRNKRFLIVQNLSRFESSVKSKPRRFTYKELEDATNGFAKVLGRGSCGIVYQGKIKINEPGLVAVKIPDRAFQDNEREFLVEVSAIGQTHHKNLVHLIGYCDENHHRALVFEFMANGTLAGQLFGGTRPSWYHRIQMALGVARGLVYLHEDCDAQIIHCDIKPQNVLVDEHFNARISDFGLAKLLMLDQSHTRTNIRGTKGYVAPEWFRSAPVSAKVDVYSFGVLLLEIVCCRRNVLDTIDMEGERAILADWACDCYAAGRLEALVENDLETLSEIKHVERFVKVAIWCLQEDPLSRPTMRKALLMLEGIVQVSPPPLPYLSYHTTDQLSTEVHASV